MAPGNHTPSKKSALAALFGVEPVADPKDSIHYDHALTRALRELVFGWADSAQTGKPAVFSIMAQIEVLAESLAAIDNRLLDKNLVINTAVKQLRLSYAVRRKARQGGASRVASSSG
jgi:hypothetical protein